MRDANLWSIGLGRIDGVRIRLHMFVVLFAVITVFLSWQEMQRVYEFAGESPSLGWIAMGSVLILLFSVLLHALAHVMASKKLGGRSDLIVLGPLGELQINRYPIHPPAELITFLAGPFTNLIICLVLLPFILFSDASLIGLLYPLAPQGLFEGSQWLLGIKLTFWINWVLLIVNLIPAMPFDGGHIFRSAILCISSSISRRQASKVVARFAQLTALGLVIFAWFLRGEPTMGVVPAWLALVLLAVFLFFSTRHDEANETQAEADDEDFFGYDFSEGYTSLERSTQIKEPPRVSPLARWIEKRKALKLQRQEEREIADDNAIDEILVRLHEGGMESLSDNDRAILHRVSERMRQRQSELD
jgi:stage IV sporulation protein FB